MVGQMCGWQWDCKLHKVYNLRGGCGFEPIREKISASVFRKFKNADKTCGQGKKIKKFFWMFPYNNLNEI